MARSPKRKSRRSRSQVSPVETTGENLRSLASQLLSGSSKRRSKRLTSLQRLQRKARKSALTLLKRKGLASKGRSLSAAKRAIRKHRGILEGKEAGYKLPADFPVEAKRALKAAGYKIQNNRLILPKGLYSRGGKVYTKAVGKRRGGRLETIQLGVDFEQQIRQAFEGLKDGDWVGFSIFGNNSYNIFQSAEGMLRDLLGKYEGVDFTKAGALTIFRVKDVSAYQKDATERALGRGKAYRERKRVARMGMRIRRKNKG